MGFLTDLAEKVSGKTPVTGKELRKVTDQPAEDQKLASWAKARVESIRASANRASYESIWLTNIAYLLGYDNVVYDTNQRKYRAANGRYPSRSRTHENLILQATQTRLAKLCKNPPRWETRPMDETQEAMEMARLDYDVLTGLWQELYLNERRLDLTMRTMECAHAYTWVRWDPTKGRVMYDEMGRPAGREGQLAVDICSALEIFPDELAANFDDCRYWFRVKARPLSYFRSNYPERGHLVEAEGPWPLSVQNELRINSMTSLGGGGMGGSGAMKDAAVEITYVEPPTERYRNGRLCVVANGVKLAATELPEGEIPLTKFDDIVIGGRYYPESPITHARPLQDQYNRNLQRTSEWTNKLVAGKYRAPRGHGIMQSGMNDQSGEIVEYNKGFEPEALQVPNIPQWVYEERDRLKRALFDQFGLSDISTGKLPSAGIPAIGMQLLLEVDESRAAIEVEQHEHAYARLGTIMLRYARCYVKTERPLKQKVKGDWNVRYWNGEMLSPKPEVQVVRGSTIPTNRQQRRQDIANAWQNGFLGNPQDPAVLQNVLGLMEYGDIAGVWEDYNLDTKVVDREIEAVEQSEFPPLFNDNDNHILAIQKLNRFRKRRSETLSNRQISIIDTLIDMHAEAQAKRQNPQLASQLKNVQQGLLPTGADPNDMAEGAEREAQLTATEDEIHDGLGANAPAPSPALEGVA